MRSGLPPFGSSPARLLVAVAVAAAVSGVLLVADDASAADLGTTVEGTWCDKTMRLRYDHYDSTSTAADRTFHNGYNGALPSGPHPAVTYQRTVIGIAATTPYGVEDPNELYRPLEPMGFTFDYFDKSYNSVSLSINGIAYFEPQTTAYQQAWEVADWGSPTGVDGIVAPLWADLTHSAFGAWATNSGGTSAGLAPSDMYYGAGTANGLRFYNVWWAKMQPDPWLALPPANPPFDFGVKMFEDGAIEFHYEWTGSDEAVLAVAGLEDASGVARITRTTAAQASSQVAEKAVRFVRIDDVEPVGQADEYEVLEDGSLTASTVLANDLDELPCIEKEAVLDGVPSHAARFQLNADGTFEYEPEADWYGVDSFTYKVDDGQFKSEPTTVNITVAPVNDPPRFAVPATVAGAPGAQSVAGFATGIDVGGAGYLDAQAPYDKKQNVSFLLTPADASSFVTPPAIDAETGDLTFEMGDGVCSGSNVTAMLVDDGGTADGGIDEGAPQTFGIVMECAFNPPPNAHDDTFTVVHGAAATTLAVLANDSDPEGEPITIVAVSQPQHGTVTYTPSGISYASDPGTPFGGPDTFEYTVSDGTGTSTATVLVHVDAPPQPEDDPVSITKGSAEQPIDALANDIDLYYSDWSAEGGAIRTSGPELRITGITMPAKGAAFADDLLVYYTPDFGTAGADQITYTVSDGTTEATGTIYITILPGLDLLLKPIQVEEGATVTITDASLLASDGTTSDEDLRFTVTTPAQHGTLMLDGVPVGAEGFTMADVLAGIVSYSHGGLELPADKVVFNLANPAGLAWTLTLRMLVSGVDDPPTATTGGVIVPTGVERRMDTSILRVSDVDSPDAAILVRPDASPLIEFRMAGAPVSEFRYTDLLAGDVWVFGVLEGQETLILEVLDAGSSVTVDVPVWVGPFNEPPFLTGLGALEVGWHQSATVTDAVFGWDDDLDTKAARPTGIKLVLAQRPLHGDLLKSGSPMAVGSSFTQHDIQSGIISYRHGGTGPDSDAAGFFVSDTAPSYPGPLFAIGTLNIAVKMPQASGGGPGVSSDPVSRRDPCRTIFDPATEDVDGDGIHAACDADDAMAPPEGASPLEPEAKAPTPLASGTLDSDGDQVPDSVDNCPTVANSHQADMDRDLLGDRCDDDADGDGIRQAGAPILDNCPDVANPGQEDRNGDGVGDACSQHGEAPLAAACAECGVARQPIHSAVSEAPSDRSALPAAAIWFGILLVALVAAGIALWVRRRGRDAAA